MADSWLEESYSNPYSSEPDTSGGVGVSDFPKAFGSGAAGLGSDAGSLIRWLGEQSQDPASEDNHGALATQAFGSLVQNVFGTVRDATADSMSPAAKEKISATLSDPNFWSLSGLALKTTQMSPAIAAAILPNLIFPGATAAIVSAAASGAVMSAGAVTDQIFEMTDKMSDGDLRQQVPMYDDMRRNGSTEEEARREYNKAVIKYKPLIAGTVGAIANVFGPAGQVARGVQGAGASAVAGAEAGLLKRGVAGAVEGGVSNAAMTGTNEYQIQQGAAEGGLREGIDTRELAESTLGAGAIGAGIGAGAGALFHGKGGVKPNDAPTVDPAIDQALTGGAGSNTGVPTADPSSVATPSKSGNTATPGVTDASVVSAQDATAIPEAQVATTTAPTPTTEELNTTALSGFGVPFNSLTERQKATVTERATQRKADGIAITPTPPPAESMPKVTPKGNTVAPTTPAADAVIAESLKRSKKVNVAPPTGPDEAQTLAIKTQSQETAPVQPTTSPTPPAATTAAPDITSGSPPPSPEVKPAAPVEPPPTTGAAAPTPTPDAPPANPPARQPIVEVRPSRTGKPIVPVDRTPVIETPRPTDAPLVAPDGEGVRGPASEVARPAGPRILADTRPEAKQEAARIKSEASRQLNRNFKEMNAPVDTGESKGKNFSPEEKAARQTANRAATAITTAHPPTEVEAQLSSKKPGEVVAARKAIAERVASIVKTADQAAKDGIKLPSKYKTVADAEQQYNHDTLHIIEARDLDRKIKAGKAKKEDYETFQGREHAIRRGLGDDVAAERRTEGELKKRTQQKGGEEAAAPKYVEEGKEAGLDEGTPELADKTDDEVPVSTGIEHDAKSEGTLSPEDVLARKQEEGLLTPKQQVQSRLDALKNRTPEEKAAAREKLKREADAMLAKKSKNPLRPESKGVKPKVEEGVEVLRGKEVGKGEEVTPEVTKPELIKKEEPKEEPKLAPKTKEVKERVEGKKTAKAQKQLDAELRSERERQDLAEAAGRKKAEANAPRRQHEYFREYDPKNDHPHLKEMNDLTDWVNKLSDEDYAAVSKEHGGPNGIDRDIRNYSDTNQLRELFQSAIERGKEAREAAVAKSPEARIEKARQETNTNPTEAQKEAGNYKKGHVSVNGHEIAIENPKGSERSGTAPDGTPWSVKMPVDYGYLKGTKGADGDPVDVFLGPDHDATHVFVVDQVDPITRDFDEHKVMMGFKNEMQAVRAYDKSFSDNMGAMRAGEVTKMTHEEFNRWVKEDADKPVVDSGSAHMLDEADIFSAQHGSAPADEFGMYQEWARTGKVPEGYVKDPLSRKFAKPTESSNASDLMWSKNLDHLKGFARLMASTARNIMTKIVGDTPVHFLSREDMARFSGYHPDDAPFGLYAYNGKDHAIYIRDDLMNNPEKLQHTLWHEVTHAATLKQIKTDTHLRNDILALMTHVNKALETMGGIPEDIMALRYGMSKPYEFIAEAFSNPAFQEVLSRMPAPKEVTSYLKLDSLNLKNMWDVFVSAIRRSLKMPSGAHSMLEAAIKMTERSMVHKTVEYESGSSAHAASEFIDKGNAKLAVKDMLERAKEVIEGPALAPTKGNPHLLGMRTFDHIARAADRYFKGNNPVRKIANIIESQRVAAGRYVERWNPVVNNLHAMEKKYKGKVWDEFAKLVHDETMAGVFADRDIASQKHLGSRDAWAISQHPDLKARYDALPADLKAARSAAMKHFTDAQNRLALKLIRNRIVTMFDNVSDPEGLAQRIHENTVTDADKDLMGEVYDTIADANTLSKIDGPYFPLMRRGNYVVKGTYDITAPKNAKALADNQFEFTDKAEADKWMEGQQLRPTVRTVYVDKTTGETHATENGKTVRITKADINAEPRYRVTVQNRHMEMFNSMREARDRVAELRSKGIKADDAVPRQFDAYGIQGDALSSQMHRLSSVMERRADARNYTPEQKDDLLRTLNEVSLSMLGATRIQSRNLPRQYVAGASKDLLRNTVEYAHATGNYEAKLDYRPQLDAALDELREANKVSPSDGFASGRQAITNEVMRRVTTRNPAAEGTKFNAMTNRILSISFMDKLMSPASSVINATQPMMTTTPYLAGQFGPGRALAHMARAYKEIGTLKSLRQGLGAVKDVAMGRTANDPVSLIMSRLSNKGEVDMMKILLDRGIIDSDSGLEVGRLNKGDGVMGKVDTGVGYLEGIGRQFPKTIEAINRSVSALAAYRLEMERSGDQARAVQFAQDTVNMTQFNYSSSNSPTFMRHPAARLALQFKKYGAGMYQMMGEQAAIALRNENPGDRARAIKSLSYTLGMHALIAGTMGLPTEPFKLAVMAANGLGLTDWSWGDVEDAQRSAYASLFGKDFGEVVARGIPRALGFDLSSRMGLDTLMGPFGEPRSNAAQDWKAYAWDAFSGAPASLITDWGGGINALAQGDFSRAAEKLIPLKAASDAIKAVRVMQEGNVSATSGKQTMTPYGAGEALTKAFGFTPAREAESYEGRASFFRKKTELEDTRRQFQQDWAGANGAAKGRIWQEVQKWNKRVAPEARLSISDMKSFQKRAEKDMKDTQIGIAAKRREKTILKDVGSTYDY